MEQNEISDKSSRFLSFINKDEEWLLAAAVKFVLLMSIEHHLQNTCEKHLKKNVKHEDMNIPEGFYQEPFEKEIRSLFNPKPLREIAKENIKRDDTQVNKELT